MSVLGRPCSSTGVVSLSRTMPPGARPLTSLRFAPWVAMILFGVNVGHAADISAGSGVVIGTHGEVLTNAHVVENCTKITVRSSSASVVARDEKNDLAVVQSSLPSSPVAVFREGGPVRAGDAVVALGYPLSGLLADTASLSVGNVSALAGLGDDSRFLQISAPVQPGNSGGPLLDASGHLIGIVTGKLDACASLGEYAERELCPQSRSGANISG